MYAKSDGNSINFNYFQEGLKFLPKSGILKFPFNMFLYSVNPQLLSKQILKIVSNY